MNALLKLSGVAVLLAALTGCWEGQATLSDKDGGSTPVETDSPHDEEESDGTWVDTSTDTPDTEDTTPDDTGNTDDTDAPDTDTDAVPDSAPLVDTDTEPLDTDVADTWIPDTDPVVPEDTDDPVIDTPLDTDVADTEPVDTDTDTDTDIVETGRDPSETDASEDTSPCVADGKDACPNVDRDGDGAAADVDCNDRDPARYPGATEVCNGVDDNCNGVDDDGVVCNLPDTGAPDDTSDTDDTTDTTDTADTVPQDPDQDGDGSPASEDCDDGNVYVRPGASEVCNGIDDNCDGVLDNDPRLPVFSWYPDGDGDHYGDATQASVLSCSPIPGYGLGADCDDTDPTIHPYAVEVCGDHIDQNCDPTDDSIGSRYYPDGDGDGWGWVDETVTMSCTQPVGFVVFGGDCNDADAATHPGVPEVCNGIDDNCDAQVDNSAVDATNWYPDADGDGYGTSHHNGGNLGPVRQQCRGDQDYPVQNTLDCDDGDSDVHPGVTEICDGFDNDCDGTIDVGMCDTDTDTTDTTPVDTDTPIIDQDGDGFTVSYDCNDADPLVSPAANERCNGADDDCDSEIDDGLSTYVWYVDLDNDGYGSEGLVLSCAQPVGYVAVDNDCDNYDPTRHPGAPEICNNGVDDNCNALDDVQGATYYRDVDGDGYGTLGDTQVACVPPSGYVSQSEDCDDAAYDINPGAAEICNDRDDDCDTDVDELAVNQVTWYEDLDRDGFGSPFTVLVACDQPSGYVAMTGDCDDAAYDMYPGAPEMCDGDDDDCDGTEDEGLTFFSVWRDRDRDGFGDDETETLACGLSDSFVPVGGDCDDDEYYAHPDAEEICDGVDNDCDTVADDGLPSFTWYQDEDEDGHAGNLPPQYSCSQPPGYLIDLPDDCDDTDWRRYPGAEEVCGNLVDEDCDASNDDCVDTAVPVDTDTGVPLTDIDGDGFPEGDDCNDNDATINPGASDRFDDGIDQDCVGGDAVYATLTANLVCAGVDPAYDACLADANSDGNAETLLLKAEANNWQGRVGVPATAYVLERTLGCWHGSTPGANDRVSKNAAGYYILRFDGRPACTTELTLEDDLAGSNLWRTMDYCDLSIGNPVVDALCVVTGTHYDPRTGVVTYYDYHLGVFWDGTRAVPTGVGR